MTDTEGNTIKVMTSAASAVTKTVKSTVRAIRPGETVVVSGTRGGAGAVKAESIRVGAAGGGGLGSLFGSSGTSAGAGPSLFGSGG